MFPDMAFFIAQIELPPGATPDHVKAWMWISIATTVTTMVVTIAKMIVDSRRETNRLKQRELELLEAREVRKKLLAETMQTKTIASMGVRRSDAAIQAANNVTEKATRAAEIATAALEVVKAQPAKVEVVNAPEHPVPVAPAEDARG